MTRTTVYVCETCRPADHDDDAPRPGKLLAEALAERAASGEANIDVVGVQCLSVCKRPCAVAVSGEGKFTYIVGDAEPNVHADDILAYAAAHGASEDGVTAWRERPQLVRKSVIARVPALGQAHGLVTPLAKGKPAR